MATKKENSGWLGKNKLKKTQQQPDYSGLVSVTCSNCGHNNDLRIAGWNNERVDPQSGETEAYMGVRFSEKQKPNTTQVPQAEPGTPAGDVKQQLRPTKPIF